VVIAVLGGLAGVVASFALVYLVGQFSPTANAPEVNVWVLCVAFGCSALVGVLAGIIPAVKAARLNPIEALKYE
jgi:putative ABC transport system permease protein